MRQEVIIFLGWHWHQPEYRHMQTICTSLLAVYRCCECDVQGWKCQLRAQPEYDIFSRRFIIFECRMNDRAWSVLSCHQPLNCTFKHSHTHPFNGLCPGLRGWTDTRKVKPIWILLKQETVSGSGISTATCKPAPRSRQITMPAPHHSVFHRPDALPATQPTVSKHWRQNCTFEIEYNFH